MVAPQLPSQLRVGPLFKWVVLITLGGFSINFALWVYFAFFCDVDGADKAAEFFGPIAREILIYCHNDGSKTLAFRRNL